MPGSLRGATPGSPRPDADLRALRTAAGRRAAGRFLIEGPGPVGAAAAAGLLDEVIVTPAALARRPELADLAPGVPYRSVGERRLRRLAGTVSPAGVLGVARLLTRPLADVLAGLADPWLVAVCVAVADPGNAGTLVRSAAAAGADAVVFAGEHTPAGPEPGVDPHNDKCVRASAGALFGLPVAVAPDAAAAVSELRDRGLAILAADAGAADDIETAGDLLAGRSAWLFGNESRGLAPATAALADAQLRVPMHGWGESLNLAAAATVCLYASARVQRERRRR